MKLSMDEVGDVENEVEEVDNVENVYLVNHSITKLYAQKQNEKVCKLYSLYRLVNQDIIRINNSLTESTLITPRKR
jgi:hypothetical protein